MMGFKPTFAIVATTLILAGCSGMELERAQGLKASGSNFSKNLYTGYLDLSKTEWQEGDYGDSDAFAMRASSAAGGKPGQPENIASRDADSDFQLGQGYASVARVDFAHR